MVKPNLNILRNLRLQLKTGFLQKEPPAYKFLQRYPPLSRDTAPPVRKIKTRNIPYLKYYENAVAKNPMYADEKVYPAYWAHEPQALTLAKKQYELLQKNKDMSEDEAYQKAILFVEELENDSYLKLKSVMDDIKGSRLPYASDPVLSSLIDSWRAKLAATPYGEMPLADQGEIDWIIQTKVLKWHEVERERRMKDPVFVMQFEKLRAAVFPEISVVSDAARFTEREEYKSKLLTLYGVNKDRLHTAKPFYYEDYAAYFSRLRDQPMLGRWEESDREALSRWIVDTLAMREVLERRSSNVIQRYIDTLRAHFFPMVRFPDRAASFKLPSAPELRALLYKNDVGYKREEGKLFIRRAYRLPQLLFPKETLTSALLAHQERLPGLLSDGGTSLLQEMQRVGLDEASLPELQRQLQEYTRASMGTAGGKALGGGADGDKTNGSDTDDIMSPLDALMLDDDEEATAALRRHGAQGQPQASEELQREASDTAKREKYDASVAGAAQGILPDLTVITPESIGKDAWEQLKTRYFPSPSTELEQRRDELFRQLVLDQPDDAVDELDLEHHRRVRSENQLVTRARLSVEYERKESARRVREWRSRGLWMEKLPRAELNIVDNRA